MAVLIRIAMIVLAYILACIAASLILTIGTLTPEWDDLTALGLQSVAVWAVVMVAAAVIGGIAMMPALLVIALTEGFSWRSSLIYAALGGVLALSLRYGLDFAGYNGDPGGLEVLRWPARARARGARRRWHCRRFCLLVVRRPQSGLLEVIRFTTSSDQRP